MLTPTGEYLPLRNKQPWRAYASALLEAKELADRNAVTCALWPAVSVNCKKMYAAQLNGIETDLGGPDLTALPAWPEFIAALRSDLRNGSESRVGACERLFRAHGWTAAERDDASLVIRPPRPLFGCQLRVLSAPSISASSLGGVIGGVRLRQDDVIVGLDGVTITRGVSQLTALLDARPAPCEHVFVVRRRGATAEPAAEAALDALEPQPIAADDGAAAAEAPADASTLQGGMLSSCVLQ